MRSSTAWEITVPVLAATSKSINIPGPAPIVVTRIIPAQHVRQKTKFYEMCVNVRHWLGHEGDDAEGDRCISPIETFFKTEKTASGSNSAESALRGTVGVWQGCAWRVRFKTSPTGPVVMLWIKSLWDLFDLEGKLVDP